MNNSLSTIQSVHARYGHLITKEFLARRTRVLQHQWSEYWDSREYVTWDDMSKIDRKKTAKKNEMHIKKATKDELDIRFVIDDETCNRSLYKKEKVNEIIYALWSTAISQWIRVWEINGNNTISLTTKFKHLRLMLRKKKEDLSEFDLWYKDLFSYLVFGKQRKRVQKNSLEHKLKQLLSQKFKNALIVICSDSVSLSRKQLWAIAEQAHIWWIHTFDEEELKWESSSAHFLQFASWSKQITLKNNKKRREKYRRLVDRTLDHTEKEINSLGWKYIKLNTSELVIPSLLQHLDKY